MLTTSFLALPALLAIGAPAATDAGRSSSTVAVTSGDAVMALVLADRAIPAWARRYNVDCSFCHAPAPPRLNAAGIRFRWAGYRMPEDIGTQVAVEDVKDYIALRGRARYVYDKTESQPTSTSAFQLSDATLFVAGPFGKNYGAFFELEREAEDELGLVAHIESAWGKEDSYGGFKVGLMHWVLRDGVAGFDRPTGIRTPIPVGNPLSSGIPFTFSRDQLGLEGYYVMGRNRISAQVLNGIDPDGGNDEADNKKDFVLTDQLLFDEAGSGLTAVGYYGTLDGADPLAPSTTSHFWRLALSANKIVNRFEALGGVVYGKDEDLPVVPGGLFATPEITALGYWVYGGYSFRVGSGGSAEGGNPLTFFGRYEFVDPDTDLDDNASRRFVAGWVLPFLKPQYLRAALEYALDFPQGGVAKRHGLTAELMLNF